MYSALEALQNPVTCYPSPINVISFDMGKRSKTSAAGEPDTTPEDAVQEAPEAVEEQAEEAGDGKDQVAVKYRDHVGQIATRVFSKAVHGKDFNKLAAEFKATNASKLVKEDEVA